VAEILIHSPKSTPVAIYDQVFGIYEIQHA